MTKQWTVVTKQQVRHSVYIRYQRGKDSGFGKIMKDNIDIKFHYTILSSVYWYFVFITRLLEFICCFIFICGHSESIMLYGSFKTARNLHISLHTDLPNILLTDLNASLRLNNYIIQVLVNWIWSFIKQCWYSWFIGGVDDDGSMLTVCI